MKVIKNKKGEYFVGWILGIPSWSKDKIKAKKEMLKWFPKYSSYDIMSMLKPRKNNLKLVN